MVPIKCLFCLNAEANTASAISSQRVVQKGSTFGMVRHALEVTSYVPGAGGDFPREYL